MTKKRGGDEPDAVEKALKALLGTKSDAEPSLLEQVTKHLALIKELRARGHTFGRIAEALQQVGMDIAENTLRLYVGRLRRQGPGGRGNNPEPAAVAKPVRAKSDGVRIAPKTAKGPKADRAAHRGEEIQSWMTDGPDETNI